MAAYNYKYVRDLLPPYLTNEVEGYEGGVDYDGDMWCSAADYIEELEAELKKQYVLTKTIHNMRLLFWLQNRPKSSYNFGPVLP